MNRLVLAILAVSFVSWSLQGAQGQSNDPVGVAQRLLGKNEVNPGESLGAIRLKALRKAELGQWGLTKNYWQRGELTYRWTENGKEVGSARFNHDQPILPYFCNNTDAQLFAVVAFGIGRWNPEAERFWLLVRRLFTPEKLYTTHSPSRYYAIYGQPVGTMSDVGADQEDANPFRFQLLENGLIIEPHHAGNFLRSIGVYDTGICTGKPRSGIHVPLLGRGVKVAKVVLSKTGDSTADIIGEQVVAGPGQLPAFKASEQVFFQIELTFPPVPSDRRITIARKFLQPDETLYAQPFEDTFFLKAGTTSKTYTKWLGRDPPRTQYGEWQIVLEIGGYGSPILSGS